MSSTTVESKLSSLQLDAQKQTTTATNNATTTRTAPERVIIDTDPGIDDVMALFLALASPAEIQVEALTITMGNHNDVELLAQNAALVLEMAHQSHEHGIPIIKGSNKPLQGVFLGEAGIEVHSKNGLGNIEPPIKNLNQAPHEQYKGVHAAQFLIDRCTAEPGQITICAIGPLTNIATAVLLGGTKFVQSVRRLTIMGGDVGQQGNMTPVAEANIYNDPDAARIVFDAFPDIHMAGLNCTHQILMTSALRQRMQKASPVGAFCHDITQHYADLLGSWNARVVMHDVTIVLYMIRPDLFETQKVTIDVETEGRLTRGMTVADYRGHWKHRKPQTIVLQKIKSMQALHDLFIERIATFKWQPPAKLKESFDQSLGQAQHKQH